VQGKRLTHGPFGLYSDGMLIRLLMTSLHVADEMTSVAAG